MTYEQAQPLVNQLVRMKHDSLPHHCKCFLVRIVGKDRAEVMPFKHKRTIIVDLSRLTPWKAANTAWRERMENRKSHKASRT